MLQTTVALVLSLISVSSVFSQVDPAVRVWAAASLAKVRPDDAEQDSNEVWSAQTKTVTLAGAGNEHVPFQVVVSVPPPSSRYQRAASGFFVEVSDLASPAARIPREQVRLYFQHVVLVYARSSPVGDTGFWPDALVPLNQPFGMDAPFRSFVKNRAVWVDVLVPSGSTPGTYAGTVRVTQNGALVDELKLELTVYDFSLPRETHLITYVGISGRHLANSYGLEPSSPEYDRLLRRYYEFLYQNRMEPWFHIPLQPAIEKGPDGAVRVTFDDELYTYYLDQLQTRRVILETAPAELLHSEPRFPLFSEPFNRQILDYLGQVSGYFERHGWKNRLVLNSPIDEPNTAQHYADTRKWAELAHRGAPGVPFLVTESPVPDDPEWGTLADHADHFSVHGNALNRQDVKEAIHREQARGGEITWYISCDQPYPQPNYFIDASAMDPVMVPWITWRYGMNGILYWSANYWPQTPDPWIDPVTYLSGFLCSDGYVLNGEGCLIYPGNRSRQHTGQDDVEGPVSSLRFELLREGIEDYEYLWLLKSLGDAELADRMAADLVVDVSAFTRNPARLLAARRKMAEKIETLSRGSR